MREIKFNFFNTRTNEYTRWDQSNVDLRFSAFYTHEYLKFLQYTGLKDKNGTEIHEGDIVKQEYEVVYSVEYHPESLGYMGHEGDEGHHIGEVVIIPSKGVALKNPIRYSAGEDKTEKIKMYKPVSAYRSEVIGNIYENPELLEVLK